MTKQILPTTIFTFSFTISLENSSDQELTSDICKEKNLSTGITKDELAQCIELGLYDPCINIPDKAMVNCYIGHKQVELRRIENLTNEITAIIQQKNIEFRESYRDNGMHQPSRNYITEGNKYWDSYVWEQCLLINTLHDKFKGFETLAECELGLYRERANKLDEIRDNLIQ